MFVCVLQLQIMSHRNFNVLGVTSLQCTTDQIALNIGLEIWNSYEISITIWMCLHMPCNFQGQYTLFCYSTKTITFKKTAECVIHIAS